MSRTRSTSGVNSGGSTVSTVTVSSNDNTWNQLPFEIIHCIFCGAECPAKFVVVAGKLIKVKCEEERLSFGDNSVVDQQLESLLIVRNILEAKEETCHELLSQFDGQCHPEHWINLCGECNKVVENYRRNMSEIAKLERKAKVIKLVLRKVIWDSNHDGSDGGVFSGVWKKLRDEALLDFDPTQVLVKKEKPQRTDDDDLSCVISLILVILLLFGNGDQNTVEDYVEQVPSPPPSISVEEQAVVAENTENVTPPIDKNPVEMMEVDGENGEVEVVDGGNCEVEVVDGGQNLLSGTLEQNQDQPLVESPVKLKRMPKKTLLRKIRKTKEIKILATWFKCSLCPARLTKTPSNVKEHRLLHEKGGPGVECNRCKIFVHKSRLDWHQRGIKCHKYPGKIERSPSKQPPPEETNTHQPGSEDVSENVRVEDESPSQEAEVVLRPSLKSQRKGRVTSPKKKQKTRNMKKKSQKIALELIQCPKCPAIISKIEFADHLKLHVEGGPGVPCARCEVYVHASRYAFHQRSSKCSLKPAEDIKNGFRKRSSVTRSPVGNIQVEVLLSDDESVGNEAESPIELQQIPESQADQANQTIIDTEQAPDKTDTTRSILVGEKSDFNDTEANGEVQTEVEENRTDTARNVIAGNSSSPLVCQPTEMQHQLQFLQELVNSFEVNLEENTLTKRLTVHSPSSSSSFGLKNQKPTDHEVYLKLRISLKTVKKVSNSGELPTPSPMPSPIAHNQSASSSKSPATAVRISDSDSQNEPNIRKWWKVDDQNMYNCRRCPATYPKLPIARLARHQRLHQKGGNGWACPCCTIFIPESPEALEKHQRIGECLHPPPGDAPSAPSVPSTSQTRPQRGRKSSTELSNECLHPPPRAATSAPSVPSTSQTRPQRGRKSLTELSPVKRTPKILPKKKTRTGLPMKYPKRTPNRSEEQESLYHSDSLNNMAYHEANGEPREHYKCKECSALIKPTPDERELQNHIELHKKERKINCLVCNWLVDNICDHNEEWHSKNRVKNNWALRPNFWVVDASNPNYILFKQEYVTKYRCRRCRVETTKKEEIVNHVILHDDDDDQVSWMPSGSNPAWNVAKYWNCDKCGGKLLEEAKEKHQDLHKNGGGSSCLACGLLVRSNLLLVQHMAYFHPEF